jgi:hypothetical protein
MVKKLTAVISFCIISSNLFSQQVNLKLNENTSPLASPKFYKKSDLPTPLLVIGVAALISPMVVFEDKKVFFALTKEVSIGKYPFGRLSFEYSFVFRSYNKSHFRFSYNYDYFIDGGDFIAFIFTPGAGYFTDTKNKGWFLHGSIGALFGPGEYFLLNPYFRYRHTFISEKTKSNIHDISLGMAFILYF